MKQKTLPSLVCLAALVAALGGLAATELGAEAMELPYVPGEVLVRFRSTASETRARTALSRVGARLDAVLSSKGDRDLGHPSVVRAATRFSVPDTLAALSRDPDVEFAEPNWRLFPAAVSNDPDYAIGRQWGAYSDDQPVVGPPSTSNSFGSQAEKAWASGATGSSTVYVAVLDEGIDLTHPDLADNIWTNPFDPVDGLDNDGNGYVDDVHGWDFYYGDNSLHDAGEDAHGTHVAGIAGARGGNGAGVAGVAWDVTVIPAKFLGPYGGSSSDAITALNYLRDLKARHGLNIVAVCNSWTGPFYSRSLHEAVLRTAKAEILFVAAAGNAAGNNDATASYPGNFSTLQGTASEEPASYEAVISVGSLRATGELSASSNYGAASVDLFAPGENVWSTLPGGQYGLKTGTSMAAPHVVGAAALYAAANTGASASSIREAILTAALPTATLQGKCATHGRLNLGDGFLQAPVVTHDVAVTGVSLPSSSPQGATTPVTVAVSNTGETAETFTVSLSATAGAPSAPQAVTVPAGGGTTLSFTWSTSGVASGSYVLTATASAVPGETDLADNSASAEITLTAIVRDVAVVSVSAPASTTQGDVISVPVAVSNEGTQSETLSVTLTATGGTTSGAQNATLAPGTSGTLWFTWNTSGATAGTKTLTAQVAALAGETDTADNLRAATCNCTAPVVGDVAVTAFSVPGTVTAGKPATVSVTVANQGNKSETFTLSVSAPAGTVSSAQTVTLAVGSSVTRSFTWSTTIVNRGTWTLTAQASVVTCETDTADNSRTVQSRVK